MKCWRYIFVSGIAKHSSEWTMSFRAASVNIWIDHRLSAVSVSGCVQVFLTVETKKPS